MNRRFLLLTVCCGLLALPPAGTAVFGEDGPTPRGITLIVMDPLAAPLACDCVQGYAQRKYEELGHYLQQQLKQPVRVFWAESLAEALQESEGHADLIIGKHSVVLSDAKKQKLTLHPAARLTAKDDSVTQTGLIVVRKDDPATTVADLNGYRIFFGPADCDEKHAAPLGLLKDAGVALPEQLETVPTCSTGAKDLLELPASVKAAAVISSYAQPLLEGCGTIQKGDLRVIGETRPVPFITAFVNESTSDDTADALRTALADVELNAPLLISLESFSGFRPWAGDAPETTSRDTGDISVAKKKN